MFCGIAASVSKGAAFREETERKKDFQKDRGKRRMKTSEITAIFDADLARVWEAVTNNADCGWRSDLSGIEITGENTFTEFANNGFPTYFTITEKRE